MNVGSRQTALWWPGGQAVPTLVSLLGQGAPVLGAPTLIMQAGRHRYVVDEADIMRLPANAGVASLSPTMGNA